MTVARSEVPAVLYLCLSDCFAVLAHFFCQELKQVVGQNIVTLETEQIVELCSTQRPDHTVFSALALKILLGDTSRDGSAA